MSLFKTREIWSASCDNDLFDLGCLKVANLGANKKNLNSIITGSYNGFLRIYNPNYTDSKGRIVDSDTLFKAHDLICETSFPSPIIQIETGRFVSTSTKQHIAILMPKKLAVYEALAFEEGNVEHGNQYTLKFIYEHVLQRTAYNMCKGSFGGTSNLSTNTEAHEYICVQSMDGMLSVYEYESFSLSCFLPKVLIPGPFKYIPKTDSFVTISSSWELESYRYQTLATSAKSYERKSNDTNAKQKRVLPEYTFNLGEAALDIDIVNNGTSCTILVLGERNLFCLTETCILKYMKKFDYNPSCFCAYPIISSNGNTQSSNSINFLVATHSKILFVHEDVKVKWAAQLENTPVQMTVAKINNMNGIIVTLSEDGKLRCCYLGTEPAFLNPIIKEDLNKPFNFESAENEYRVLQAQIKHHIMNTGSVITSNVSKTGLIMTVDVPKTLDQTNPMNRKDTELKDPLDAIPSITCKLTIKSVETFQNVKISVNACLPIVAVPDTFCFSSIGSVPCEQEICFYMKTKHIPLSLNVSLCASYYATVNGPPKVSETNFRLPLKLIMKSGQHVGSKIDTKQEESKMIDQKARSNLKKITIETNKPCANLTEIFPEFSSSYIATNGNVLAAQFFGHAEINISIQGSKSGTNKYRLQSDTYDSLWIVAQEFVTRLQNFYTKQSQDVVLTYQENLPTEDFKAIIDKHLELRLTLESYKEMLDQCCVQFRAIQKRLLAKFKDKSPTSLDNMDALLEATHRQIVSISDNFLNTQKELSITTNSLNCMGSLYVLLTSLAFKFNKDAYDILESVLTNKISDSAELGWIEIVNTAVSNLMRIALSKSSKEASTAQQSNQLKLPTDSSKLEKQLKSLISKFEGGSSIVSTIYYNKNANDLNESFAVQSSIPSKNPTSFNELPSKSKVAEIEKPPVKKPPVAKASKFTMGEDYEEQETKEAPKKKFGEINLPTFDELMQSEEYKNKTPFNYDSD